MKKKLLIIAVVVILAAALGIYLFWPLKLTDHLAENDVLYISSTQPVVENGSADILYDSSELEKGTQSYTEVMNLLKDMRMHRTWNTFLNSGAMNGADFYLTLSDCGAYMILSSTGEVSVDGHRYILYENTVQQLYDMLPPKSEG